jgi:hypothetical protein
VNFGREKIKIDAIVGEKVAVPFADGNGAQQWLGPSGTGLWRWIKHGKRCGYPVFSSFLKAFCKEALQGSFHSRRM